MRRGLISSASPTRAKELSVTAEIVVISLETLNAVDQTGLIDFAGTS
jgi:hypothetical protein